MNPYEEALIFLLDLATKSADPHVHAKASAILADIRAAKEQEPEKHKEE